MRTLVEKRSKNHYTVVIDKGRKPDDTRDRDYIPTEITSKRIAEEVIHAVWLYRLIKPASQR